MTTALATPNAFAWVATLDIGRDEARERAERELSEPRYAEDSSSIFRRVLDWIAERLANLIDFASGGALGRVIIAVVAIGLAAGIILAIRRSRPDARRRSTPDAAVFGTTSRTAAQYRADADAAADAADWETAVIERFRAVAAELEERDVVHARPGRTAAELAAEAGGAMPPASTVSNDLTWAAALFNGVRYGHQHAAAADDTRLRSLDEAIGGNRRRAMASDSSGMSGTSALSVEPPR